MSARNRTPAILEPYLHVPPELSLILLTGTLGCTANWLTARIAAYALQEESSPRVLLVSWMHDESFWRLQIKRLANVNDGVLAARFAFIDRLSEVITGRSTVAELDDIDAKIAKAFDALSGKVLLILDMPDVLLATRPDLQAQQLDRLLMKLRAHPRTHSVVLSCVAEPPHLDEPTANDIASSAFIIQQAHKARSIFSVRELETGSARDVSGILRITNDGESGLSEFEKRYLVQRDGALKID